MIGDLKELWRFREILLMMIQRELKIRYKNSFLGFVWSLLNPLATVVVLTLVFKYIMRIDVDNYSAYILAGYLPYTFFTMALMDASHSVASSTTLIKKVYFPREILPLSKVFANFIHLILALGVFFFYLLTIYVRHPQVSPFQLSSVYLPLLLLINLFLATGLGLLLSAWNVFYDDVKYVTGIVLHLLFFISPVMYFSEQVRHEMPDAVYTLYHLNPVAMMVTAYRKILLAPQPVRIGEQLFPPIPLDWGMLGIAAAFSILILWYGYKKFNSMKWSFVERV